jgi:hypothetical protein
MKANPMGMLWMILTGWPDRLLKAAWPGRKVLPQGSPVARMNKFTLLDDGVRAFGGAAAAGWVGETDQQRQLPRVHHPGGGRRRLFGGGEGPGEAVAGARQDAWNGSTQAGVRNKMRNNDLRFAFGHASVALRSPS